MIALVGTFNKEKVLASANQATTMSHVSIEELYSGLITARHLGAKQGLSLCQTVTFLGPNYFNGKWARILTNR